MTRKGVYAGTKYEPRTIHNGKLDAGYHSLLWSWLRNQGYVRVESGYVYNTYRPAFCDRHTPCTAVCGNRGKAPVYSITDAGLELLLGVVFRTATQI